VVEPVETKEPVQTQLRTFIAEVASNRGLALPPAGTTSVTAFAAVIGRD
jgi:hypothetical protein